MSAALDNAFQTQRIRLTDEVSRRAAILWQARHNDRELTLAELVPLVEAGQRHTVALVDAYLTAAAREAGLSVRALGLDPSLFVTSVLRGVPADEVYGRTFGALAGQLEQGAEYDAARLSALGSLDRLVRTDMQMAHTASAHEWMQRSEFVVGYRRVLGPGKNCSLCRSASTRTYRKSDLMPIHERCHCSVTARWLRF